jgi:hypothetical protein
MAKTGRNAGPISLGRCFEKPGADQIHGLERKLNGKIKLRTLASNIDIYQGKLESAQCCKKGVSRKKAQRGVAMLDSRPYK